MRRLMLALAVLLVFSIQGYAQTGEKKAETGMMGDSMMQMCMPMMKQMMGQGMMTTDMMRMMMDMMKMQKKMMAGMSPAEKKAMMTEMDKMMGKVEMMMSMQSAAAGEAEGTGAKLKCAEEWLKKAIDLHEIHIKDPKTATDASQMEMMDQMKHARECITGGPSEKTDPHKH